MPRFKYFNPDYEKESYKYRTDWRSQRAHELLQECRPTHSTPRGKYLSEAVEGKAVIRYSHYLRAIDQGYGHERKQAKLMQEYFDIEAARAIERKPGSQRLELRLRLLAGESARAIGTRMNLDHRVVFAYSIYFFDVRDAVHQYRFTQRMKWQMSCGIQESDFTQFGRFETYCYAVADAFGAAIIPVLLDTFNHFGASHDLDTVIGRRRESTELNFASITLPSNEHTLGFFLAMTRRNQTKMFRDETFTKVFSDFIVEKLYENTPPSPRDVVDVDAVEPKSGQKKSKETVSMAETA